MAKSRNRVRTWSRALPYMTLAFGAILFGFLTIDSNEAFAQGKGKGKGKLPFEDKKGAPTTPRNIPTVKSLTEGQKVEAAALTKIINQEIAKRLKAENVKSA